MLSLCPLEATRCEPLPNDRHLAVEGPTVAHGILDFLKKARRAAFLRCRCGAPVVAGPGAKLNPAVFGRTLDEEELLGSALSATQEQVERFAHREIRRSATIAPKSSARYSNENLYNDQAAGIHSVPRATRTTPNKSAPSSSAAAAR